MLKHRGRRCLRHHRGKIAAIGFRVEWYRPVLRKRVKTMG
jgi:hypothetical protein